MSHFTTINTQVKDIDSLRAACAEMQFTVLENANARGFAGDQRQGELVIQLKGPFDIAVNKGENGSYTLATDWWNGHVEKEVGKDYGRLLQLYAVHKASQEARKRGYFVMRKLQKGGAIKLTIGGV